MYIKLKNYDPSSKTKERNMHKKFLRKFQKNKKVFTFLLDKSHEIC